jgi:protein-L-isoaspartate(D-aspartate) O-methyltransferase
MDQIAQGGFMLIRLDHGGLHPLIRVWKSAHGLQGKVVGWSGFMPMRGALQGKELWAKGFVRPEGSDVVGERAAWSDFPRSESLPGSNCLSGEVDFFFYLTLRDRRACWGPSGPGLSEDAKGWAAVGEGKLRWLGEPTIVAELERLYED